ncbi:hypothetical protein SLEP1_g42308 [Rubroshorea leprosula]|uniref:Reverse transcriptase zinc-binding domain-containing protein n=1 Tax=Rubroshorea leprosula TaxID=152421 RepID=A0AAV5L9T8_9ROSI|nr:hypothetical protein SLEP1_g42308 [Rubroshorea leprosula]
MVQQARGMHQKVVRNAVVDWRQHNVLPDIVDQANCDCCWAVVACNAISTAQSIQYQNPRTVYSYQQLIDCCEEEKWSTLKPDEKHKCQRSSYKKAFRCIMTAGLSFGKEKKCNQMGNTKDGMWKWDLAWRRSLFEWEADSAEELNVMIKDTRISPGSPDKWLWTHNNDGNYSTKSAYSMLIKDHDGLNAASTFKRVWNPILPNKITAFNWQVLLNRIPTKLNLLKRGCAKGWEDSKCVMCEAEEEDSDHLLLKCSLVKWLWKACAAWWGINVRLENNCWDTFKKLGEGNKDSRIREGWDCIWNALVWSVWLARNQKIFQQSEQKKEKILELIQLRAFLWIKARKARCTFTISDWLNNPTACLTVNSGRKRKRASRTDKTSKEG